MGCFLACFGGDEDRKRRRRRSNRSPPPQRNERYIPRRRSPSPKRLALEAVDSELSLREKLERDGLLCESPPKELKEEAGDLVYKLSIGEKPEHNGPPSETPLKKLLSEVVAGDLISEPREESKHGTPLPENSPKKFAVVVADDSVSAPREKSDQEGSAGSRKKVTFDLNVITYEAASGYDELRDSQEDEKEAAKEIQTASSPCAYPLNHRYQDCASSDDEDVIDDEEEDYNDSDIDEEDDDQVGFHVGIEENEEESYESFFSLPLEKAEGKKNSAEVNSPGFVVLANHSARDRSRYVHSVLNPVENLSKWKEIKDGAVPLKNSMKENANSEPTIKTRTPTVRASRNHSTQHEVSVDTSLSTWLVVPEKSQLEVNEGSHSIRSASSLSREEQPILGALTVEDIKQSSVTSSPRRSPSRNPDDTPIMGTVGSYWNSNSVDDSSATSRLRSVAKGIPNSTSKYREDKKVSWHSSPFEERLERALKEGSAADSCSLLPSAAVC